MVLPTILCSEWIDYQLTHYRETLNLLLLLTPIGWLTTQITPLQFCKVQPSKYSNTSRHRLDIITIKAKLHQHPHLYTPTILPPNKVQSLPHHLSHYKSTSHLRTIRENVVSSPISYTKCKNCHTYQTPWSAIFTSTITPTIHNPPHYFVSTFNCWIVGHSLYIWQYLLWICDLRIPWHKSHLFINAPNTKYLSILLLLELQFHLHCTDDFLVVFVASVTL